jgi:hypothetical protein
VSNPVLRAITNPLGDPALDVFLHWCDLKGVRPIPISPTAIAGFVMDSGALGIEKIAATVKAISDAYLSRGLADPTAGGPVGAAINRIAHVEPPRSWKAEAKSQFKTFPYELQVYLEGHERQRENTLRKAQNEAANLRNELKKSNQPKEVKDDGTEQDTTTEPGKQDQSFAGRN